MLKDDRMMSMLTFVVIMIAVGTLIQRVDVLERYFGGETSALEFRRDEAIVRANSLSGIDVLSNDLGLREGDAEHLIVAEQPGCGRVFVRDGQVQYLPAERCVGSQTFRYALSGRSYEQTGEVTVVVRLSEPTQSAVESNAQRDIAAPTPASPSGDDQRGGATPATLAAPPSAVAGAGGADVQASRMPRPQAPSIASLPDPASGAEPAGPGAAGVRFGTSGMAPSMTTLSEGLADAPEGASAPGVQMPDPEASPSRAAEAAGRDASATVALARIEPAPLPGGEQALPSPQHDTAGLGANVKRSGLPEIDPGGSAPAGLGHPGDALASVRALDTSTGLAPVDTSPPSALSEPGAAVGTGAPPSQPSDTSVNARPSVQCTVPPALILDIGSAGLTEVIIDSPCHANTAAGLSYDGLTLGVALDAAGAGTITAAGFQQASDATLRFTDSQTIEFNIPFADTERMDRIALVWDSPVELDLHAFEFGAQAQDKGHVGPDNPRSHDQVRRRGGGYLKQYRPVGGIGHSVSVYTYWRRYGGRSGVVSLEVDFASREGPDRPDTCGGGSLADPGFMVIRSTAGELERPRHRRLAPVGCAEVVNMADRFIGDAVDDLIIRQR